MTMAVDEGRHVLRAWLETCRFHVNFGCFPVLCPLLVASHHSSVSVCRSCALLLANAGVACGGYSRPWPSVGFAVPVPFVSPICLSLSACFRVSGFACLPSWFLCLFPSLSCLVYRARYLRTCSFGSAYVSVGEVSSESCFNRGALDLRSQLSVHYCVSAHNRLQLP
jgi:hypothetical protein